MAKYDLSKSVADEHHIESGLVRQFCGGKIVCGNKSNALPALFVSNEIGRYGSLAN
jgi:hypothetical protein